MKIKAKVEKNWEVIIPKKIMKFLSLKPKDKVIFEIADNDVRLKPGNMSYKSF